MSLVHLHHYHRRTWPLVSYMLLDRGRGFEPLVFLTPLNCQLFSRKYFDAFIACLFSLTEITKPLWLLLTILLISSLAPDSMKVPATTDKKFGNLTQGSQPRFQAITPRNSVTSFLTLSSFDVFLDDPHP